MEKDYEKQMEELGAILSVNCIDNQNDVNYINTINEISKSVQETLKLIPDVLKEDIQNRINEHNIKTLFRNGLMNGETYLKHTVKDIEKLCPDIDFKKLK